ncbi:MAG TPA: response regulator [Vicinamibacterales bacterium]|nr:response regulator [Vicinamibacterales bacterium]
MSNPQHILVVDDDPRIRTMLRRYLEDEGFKVSEAGDGVAMRRIFESGAVDLVMLDVAMPGEDGISLARHIRQQSRTPIIMLTGKDDVIDRVAGLEAGADDYVPKPFHLREILARIRTVLRRAQADNTAPPASAAVMAGGEGEALHFQGWTMDLLRRELRKPDGGAATLTSAEFELLRVFATHPNRVLNRDQLMELVKGREWEAYDRAVDTLIVRLRKKVEADPSQPALIKTVRGAGYVFAAPVTKG